MMCRSERPLSTDRTLRCSASAALDCFCQDAQYAREQRAFTLTNIFPLSACLWESGADGQEGTAGRLQLSRNAQNGKVRRMLLHLLPTRSCLSNVSKAAVGWLFASASSPGKARAQALRRRDHGLCAVMTLHCTGTASPESST